MKQSGHMLGLVLFAVCASILLTIAAPFMFLVGVLIPKVGRQLSGRELFFPRWMTLGNQGVVTMGDYFVFYCSSAGEFEQALPLLDRLRAQGRDARVVFFSRSGLDFARAREYSGVVTLAPLDTILGWWWLLCGPGAHGTARFSVVVRHEIWPSFVCVARWCGPVVLINGAVGSELLPTSAPSRTLKRVVYSSMAHLFVVDESDGKAWDDLLKLRPHSWSAVGDTKYDRVLERAAIPRGQDAAKMSEMVLTLAHGRKILVVGSAWSEDVTFVGRAMALLSNGSETWFTVIVPHDLSEKNLSDMRLSWNGAMSQGSMFEVNNSQTTVPSSRVAACMVAKLGVLSELYAVAQAAWVGGGLHHRVHNVLESLVRGIPTAHGPLYKTSREAVAMVESAASVTMIEPKDFADWLGSVVNQPVPLASLHAAVRCRAGAADRLAKRIGEILVQ